MITAFNILILIFLFFFGAAVYSFLNVVIFRVPRGEEFVKTRSHCPGCGRILTPLELVPVVSYICLGGKCKNCGSKIGIRDVSIEVFGGLSAIACAFYAYFSIGNVFAYWGQFWLLTIAYFSMIGAMNVLFFINLDTGKTPVGTLIAFVITGILCVFAMPTAAILSRLIGMAIGCAICAAVSALTRKEDILADAVIGATAGFLFGWETGIGVGAVAVLLGALTAIILVATGKKLSDRFKLVPVLCLAVMIGLFFGTQIAELFAF